jgi:hypothetical protein
MKNQSEPWLQDLEAFFDYLSEMLAESPPPVTKPASSEVYEQIAPDLLDPELTSQFPSFQNAIFDEKTTQLIVFSMLLARGVEASRHYAYAAHCAGASWKELYTIAELAEGTSDLKSRLDRSVGDHWPH